MWLDDKVNISSTNNDVWLKIIHHLNVDEIIVNDYKKLFLDFLNENSEILLLKILEFDDKHFNTFYFSKLDKWIIMWNLFNWEIPLISIKMPWDWVKWMLFAIKYSFEIWAKKIVLNVQPQKRTPNMKRRTNVLTSFYESFLFNIYKDSESYMFLHLNNYNLKILLNKSKEYLEIWIWK